MAGISLKKFAVRADRTIAIMILEGGALFFNSLKTRWNKGKSLLSVFIIESEKYGDFLLILVK